MAGIFDFLFGPEMGPNMTPQERKALAARSGAALKGTPAGGAVSAAMEGEYIPRGQPVGQASRVAGVLGVDPVSTQSGAFEGEYQARGSQGAPRPSGSLGVDPVSTQSQPGKSVATRGASSVSGLLEGPAAEVAEQGAKAGGRGLLGTLGRYALGPVGAGVQMALTPGELGNSEKTREQEEADAARAVQTMGPEVAQGANQFAQGVVDRAVQRGLGRATDLGIMGGAPSEPQTVEGAEGKLLAQRETQRQTVQAGTLKGLQTGAVSRPALAQAVVQADVQKAGKELTPDQQKEAIAEETQIMKTMDDNQLSKYVSYALLAGGLLAVALDKTGKAGDAFANSFNRQLDRGLEMRKQDAAAKAAAAKAAMEERKIANQERDTSSNIEYRDRSATNAERKTEGVLENYDRQAQIARDQLGATLRGQDIRAGIANADRASREDIAELGAKTKIKIQKMRDAASGGDLKAPELTTKDAESIVKNLSGHDAIGGIIIEKAAKPVIAQQLRATLKNNPYANPKEVVKNLAKGLKQNEEYSPIQGNLFSRSPVGILQ